MKSHPGAMRRAQGFLALACLTLAGCGDTATSILRAGANQKSELTDRLSKVTDEATARAFVDKTMKGYTERLKNLNEKWEKWIKEIEDDYRGKERVLPQTTNTPGSPEWEKDMQNYSKKMQDDSRFAESRDAFINYMKNITADNARFEREKVRIAALIDQVVEEEKAKGGERTSAGEICPSLVKINSPDTFKSVTLTGAVKRQAPGAN